MDLLTFHNVKKHDLETISNKCKKYVIANEKNDELIKFSNKNITITIYKNNNLAISATHAHLFVKNNFPFLKNYKHDEQLLTKILYPSECIGADESGVGDYFGPIVFVICYIDEKDIKENDFKNLLIDSKKMNFDKIKNTYKKIINYCKYYCYIQDNKTFNEQYKIYNNQNILKSLAYVNAINHFFKKYPDLNNHPIIIDKYTRSIDYTNEKLQILKDVYFIEKSEDQFYNVAAASIIARYHYLLQIEELKNKYDQRINLGSDFKIKEIVRKIKNEKQESEWTNFIKAHFKL